MNDAEPSAAEKPKICPHCGRSFGCGAATAACRCFAVALPPAHAAALRERFADCLCSDCLTALAAHGRLPRYEESNG